MPRFRRRRKRERRRSRHWKRSAATLVRRCLYVTCPNAGVSLMGHGEDLLSRTRFLSLTISPQIFQQRLGLLEVSGVKALGEPAVDGCERLVGCGSLALLLPQPTQAHPRPQLQRLRLLAAGDVK